jgi:arylsulfatase A-like enzyme
LETVPNPAKGKAFKEKEGRPGMNVIWITSDSFRRDHLGAYGNEKIITPALDRLAARSIRFQRHYAAGFPTMPTRADHFSGRWTMSFMGWSPLPPDLTTLAQILSAQGLHTAAVVDTPFYLREGMNYDRGFKSFLMTPGQEGSGAKTLKDCRHESQDRRAAWRFESDHNAPQTFIKAMRWLERHYKEKFFLYIDTWDPHEPWDAPAYYTELYWPDYDGEVIDPIYGYWPEVPGFTRERLDKARATYRGELTMVDTWLGYLLGRVENMGLLDKTAVIFTSDHGFYFGEHGGLFGKMVYEPGPDGRHPSLDDWDKQTEGGIWGYSPLYEEIVRIPLLIYLPGMGSGVDDRLTSAVDLMPTVLEILGCRVPAFVEGFSLLPGIKDPTLEGREYTISSIPFADPGDPVRSVDNFLRLLKSPTVTTVTGGDYSLLYSPVEGRSELYDLSRDPAQEKNIISDQPEAALELHQRLVEFMRRTKVAEYLLKSRLELKI